MAKKKTIKNENGEILHPVTDVTAVEGLNEALAAKQDVLQSGENIKTINGESILGSGNIIVDGGGSTISVDSEMSETSENPVQNKVITQAVNAKYTKPAGGIPASDLAPGTTLSFKPFNSSWPTSTTLEAFCAAVMADSSADVGMSYYGGLSCSGLPTGMIQGDVIVEILGESNNKVIKLEMSSTEVAPYNWEGSYWADTFTGWKSWQEKLVSGENIKTVNGTSLLGSGNIQAGEPNAVKFTEQTLTEEQKTQARTNIGAGTYSKAGSGIPKTDLESEVQTSLGKADTAYQKPGTGVPKTDMESAVQISLGKADTAYQKPVGGIPKSDLDSGVQQSLDLADSAVQADPVGSVTPPVDPSAWATAEEVDELELKVDDLNSALGIVSGETSISPSGSVISKGINDYGEIFPSNATSYIIVYLTVSQKTKIRIQHTINGPSTGVGFYGYVDSIADIVDHTIIQGKGGVRTTNGSYDETIEVAAGKVFVLSTQTSKCSYSLSIISVDSGTIDTINQRLSSLEESSEEIVESVELGTAQTVESLDSSVSSLYIDSTDKIATSGSSAYVIFYKAVFEKTKFRIVQAIDSASYALGKIGYVDTVADIVNGTSPTMLKTTSATTGDYDTIVEVPAGKVMVISGCTTASKYSISVYRVASTSIIDSLAKYPKRGVNLIQDREIREGFYVDSTTGMFSSGNGYCAFEIYFPKDRMRLYMNGVYPGYYVIYDRSGNVLDSGGGSSADRKFYSGYMLPDGAYRGRFSADTTKANVLSYGFISYYHGLVESEISNRVTFDQSYTISPLETAPTDYIGRDMSTFRKICCIGDSLTAGAFNVPGGSLTRYEEYSYPTFLAKISGTNVVNMGDSGESAVSWWNLYQNDERLSDIDCAIIQLGVNDSIDTWDSATNPAFINIVNKLKENNPRIIIFLAGIINGKSYRCAISTETYYAKDQKIRTLYENNWANDDQVFFIDWAKWGHLRDLKADLYNTDYDDYNVGHLSAYGYNRLAQDYYNYVGWIMHNDDQRFKGIQFIRSS